MGIDSDQIDERIIELEKQVAALKATVGGGGSAPTSGNATFDTVTIKNKLKLQLQSDTDYVEIQTIDVRGRVIAQQTAHLGIHSGRSTPEQGGGHYSLAYILDLSDPDGRRGSIDHDFATAKNGYWPAIWFEKVRPAFTQGSAIFHEFGDKWYRLDRRSDGVAVWTPTSKPPYA